MCIRDRRIASVRSGPGDRQIRDSRDHACGVSNPINVLFGRYDLPAVRRRCVSDRGAWSRSRLYLRYFDDNAYLTLRGVCLHDFLNLETIKRATKVAL